MAAMDLTQAAIESSLRQLKPHFLFSDFASWSPFLCHKLGIKSVHYYTISLATVGYLISPTRKIVEKGLTGSDLMEPPLGFPSSSIKLSNYEARGLAAETIKEYGKFVMRQLTSLNECDAIGLKTCREIEGPYCDYIEQQFEKPVILAGPVVPELPNKALEERWEQLFSSIQAHTVIFCAFGSECVLNKGLFQELVLGLELTEAMVSDCQLVLLPHVGDQIINARLMAGDLKVGVEVEKGEEDGVFSKDDVYKAVMTVMDDYSELGNR
ncbi:hypothetical protein PTKIN_Ptkin01aG0111200 [Pterospermum kingtungense]